MSIGERQWAPAPGGITVQCGPTRPARAWEAVAEELCAAVRGGSGERLAVRGGSPPATPALELRGRAIRVQ